MCVHFTAQCLVTDIVQDYEGSQCITCLSVWCTVLVPRTYFVLVSCRAWKDAWSSPCYNLLFTDSCPSHCTASHSFVSATLCLCWCYLCSCWIWCTWSCWWHIYCLLSGTIDCYGNITPYMLTGFCSSMCHLLLKSLSNLRSVRTCWPKPEWISVINL